MPTIAEATAAHVIAHGPCLAEEIHAALRREGVTTSRTDNGVRSALRCSRLVLELPDGRWDARTRALAGCVLTVRPRSRLGDGVLWVHDDLAPMHLLLELGPLPLRSGGAVSPGTGKVRTLVGPRGWLPELEPGGLLGLRWDGQALDVAVVADVVPLDDPRVSAVRLLLQRHREALSKHHGHAVDLAEVLMSALGEAPGLLAEPLPPLSELLGLTSWPDAHVSAWHVPEAPWEVHDAETVVLRLPRRVAQEIERRADLLGEAAADHASVLLAAAIDRVGRVSAREPSWTYDDERTYDGGYGSVLRPHRWQAH